MITIESSPKLESISDISVLAHEMFGPYLRITLGQPEEARTGHVRDHLGVGDAFGDKVEDPIAARLVENRQTEPAAELVLEVE